MAPRLLGAIRQRKKAEAGAEQKTRWAQPIGTPCLDVTSYKE